MYVYTEYSKGGKLLRAIQLFHSFIELLGGGELDVVCVLTTSALTRIR